MNVALTATSVGTAIVATVLTSPGAWAQDPVEVLPEDEVLASELETEGDEPAPEGWYPFLRLSISSAFAHSDKVIGNADGGTWTAGIALDGALGFFSGPHEWRSTLLLQETFTQTPLIDEFVKSADELDLGTIYMFHVPSAPWFGPFVRARLSTSILTGRDVRAEDTTYLIAQLDGTVATQVADRLRLTDPFSPLTFRETVGVFFRPSLISEFELELLVGFGVRETIADDQRAVQDDEDTDPVEVVELASFNQAGSELSLRLWGTIEEDRMFYSVSNEIMIPFINDLTADDDRGAIDLTNIDIRVQLGFQIVEWAGLAYEFRALKEPQLLDDFQLSNSLLLTVGYTFLGE